MPIPTVRATALIDDESTGQNSLQVGTIPATAQAGDVALMVACQSSGTNTCTTPTGWTQLRGPTSVDNNLSSYLWAKKLAAGDPGATVNLQWSGGSYGVGVIVVYRDADTLAELVHSETPNAPGGSSLPMSAVTTTEPDCAVAQFVVGRVATGTVLGFTAPSGYTRHAESNTGRTSSPNFTVAHSGRDAGAPTAGSYSGSSSWTANQSTTGALLYGVALTPAPAGNVAPTANAGADQANVEPWTTVTLTGSDSDSDGTISTRAWTQTAGTPTVTLTGASTATATFKAPGSLSGTTLTFRYRVTDNGGATAEDTMTVAVLAANERAVVGGVEVPMEVRAP